MPRDSRLPRYIAIGCGAAAALGLCVAGGAAIGVLVTGETEPGPFGGDGSFEMALTAEEPGGPGDGAALAERLEDVGVEHEIEQRSPTRIELHLEGVADAQAVLDHVLPPRQLGFHIVEERRDGPFTLTAGETPPAGLETLDESATIDGQFTLRRLIAAPDPETLEPIVRDAELAAGRVARIECVARLQGKPGRQCVARVLHSEPFLTHAQVRSASAQMSELGDTWQVNIGFDDRGAKRFGDTTAAHVDDKIAIVVDDRIVSAPVIQDPIRGGEAQITLGGLSPLAEQEREARSLAAALRPGARLEARWRLESLRMK